MMKDAMGDVIVLLPGITGSVLRKDGKDVWAVSGGAIARALKSLGESVQELRLRDDPPDVKDLGDGVTADRLVSDVHLIPGLWKIDGYSKISEAIASAFAVTPGQNYFEFPYDWRRDNRVAARKLERASREWLLAWRKRSGNDEAKLVLVAHSMGGLIARYFLECLEGWRDTRTLITFGTPYRGSLNALDFIANGMRKKLGPVTVADLSDLLRSFTSVYQLLPIYPCCDAGNGRRLRVSESPGIPHLDLERATAALAFHHEIRNKVKEHQADAEYNDGRYGIHPIIGVFQPTLQSARLTPGGLDLMEEIGGTDEGGDGTVPRVSATPLEVEREAGAMFAAERHGSLQNFDPVIAQLRGVLSGLRIDTSKYFAPSTSLGLDIEDAYLENEQIGIAVRPSEEPVVLTAEVFDVATGEAVRRQPLSSDADGCHRAELTPLPAGTYRLRVRGEFAVQPVTDIFAVFS